MADTARSIRGKRPRGTSPRKTHSTNSAAWQAESVIAYARVLLARSTSDLSKTLSGTYAQQLDRAESRLAADPEHAKIEAEAVLATLESREAPQGRRVDMVDV
ncbi:MAG: hypothetical protein ACRDIE_07110, partial [Chloroflexota bacterium]